MKERSVFFFAMIIVSLQFFIFFPIFIWTQNQFNFSINFSDSLNIIAYILLAIVIFSLLFALITPKIIRRYLLPFFVLLSVLIFVQQNILVWDYGVLDGKNLGFSANNLLGWFDVSLWVIGGVLLIARRKLLIKHAGIILTFSGIVSSTVLLTALYSYDFNTNKNSASITEDSKFTYSKNKNVLLFLLDGFQSDLFWEIIDKEPELKNNFSGFTFYPDTASVFAKTYPSVPVLLTGRVYQKKQSIHAFLNDVYKGSILAGLIDSDWNVGLYPYLKNLLPINDSIMNNYINSTATLEKVENYLQALDLSLFRLAPHHMKKKLFNKGEFVIEKNLIKYLEAMELFSKDKVSATKLPKINKHRGKNFLENLKTHGSVESGKPTFRFYHLLMPHSPFLLNRDLEYGPFETSFKSYKDYAYASLKLMISYLEELKKLEVYDNSAIIIVADHGGGSYTRNKYDSKKGEFQYVSVNGKEIASGKPLLLVKGYQDSGQLKFSVKPISLVDIAPTIASFADIDAGDLIGDAIDKILDGQERLRKFYFYKFTGWGSKYLQDFSIFNITGNVYENKSWVKIGTLVAEDEVMTKEDSKYILSKTIGFGTDRKIDTDYQNKFLVGDNYKYSHSSIESIGQQISLSVDLDEPLKIYEVYKLELGFSLIGSNSEVMIEVDEKNFTLIKGHNSSSKQKGRNSLSKQVIYFQVLNDLVENKFNLKIYIENNVPDSEIKLSKLKIQNIKLAQIDNRAVLKFSDNLDKYYPRGFQGKKNWGRWSSKKEASLFFKTPGEFCENSYLLLNIRKFSSHVDTDKFQVFINGNLLELIHKIKQNGGYKLFYDCSSYNTKQSGIVKLSFKTNIIDFPSEVINSKDERKAGAAFSSLQFGRLKDISFE